MSKCNAWGSTAAPQPPRFRPSSPVIFSGPSRRSSIDSSSFGGTEEGDGEDLFGETLEEYVLFKLIRPSARLTRTT